MMYVRTGVFSRLLDGHRSDRACERDASRNVHFAKKEASRRRPRPRNAAAAVLVHCKVGALCPRRPDERGGRRGGDRQQKQAAYEQTGRRRCEALLLLAPASCQEAGRRGRHYSAGRSDGAAGARPEEQSGDCKYDDFWRVVNPKSVVSRRRYPERRRVQQPSSPPPRPAAGRARALAGGRSAPAATIIILFFLRSVFFFGVTSNLLAPTLPPLAAPAPPRAR